MINQAPTKPQLIEMLRLFLKGGKMYENNQNAAAGETEDPVEFRNQKNRYPWWVKAVDTPTIEMDSKPVIPNGVKQRIQASS